MRVKDVRNPPGKPGNPPVGAATHLISLLVPIPSHGICVWTYGIHHWESRGTAVLGAVQLDR
jgi:hypothetical protein